MIPYQTKSRFTRYILSNKNDKGYASLSSKHHNGSLRKMSLSKYREAKIIANQNLKRLNAKTFMFGSKITNQWC